MADEGSSSGGRGAGAGGVAASRRGVRPLKAALMAIFSLSLALAIALVVVFTVKNIHRPKFHGEFQASHLFSWQRQRSGFIYTCTSEYCLKEGEQLQKHVAWTLDPCEDFYDYVCSSTKPASSVRRSAVRHFLREIHDVIDKYSRLGWLKRTRLTNQVSSFYKACRSGHYNSVPEQMDQTLVLLKLSGKDAILEEGLASLAKILQVFPLMHVSVTTKAKYSRECIALRRPKTFNGDHIFDIPKAFSKKYVPFVKALLGSEQAAQNVREVDIFLKKFSGLWSESYQKMSEYETTTIDELRVNGLNWKTFLFKLIESATKDHCVVILSQDYFKHVEKMFQKFTTNQVADFVKYSAILHLYPFVKLQQSASLATYQNISEEVCSLLTYRVFNYIFVRHFNSTVRLDVITSAGMKEAILRNSYRSVLDSASEIPMTTVNNIEDEIMSIGPTYFSLMDDVDAYYSSNNVDPDVENMLLSYVKAKAALSEHYVATVLRSGETIRDGNLELTSQYDPDTSVLTVPLSIAPLVLKGREFFLESSTVGFVMTRFLYHVFQEKFLFGMEAETEALHGVKGCLERQYGAIEVGPLNKTLDGHRTLRENMADNVAVTVLHRAYRTSLLFYISTMDAMGFQNVFLHFENLPSVSSEQLFYLMFGQSFCDPDEDTERVIDDATWAPAKYRVNVPLSNYEPFSKAFECQPGSKMNPKKKCRAV
ncbi:hypothetical protein HPB51_003087 [Rhipicephalus microplus]|uniref:M13 family peptidase n=1 Tax=Rhipicephalus microplus TaxID=6941 RepID=A0A9J6EEZ7_RHIMP|nr:neprilysin-1-like [Rhipicephalus microplus]KAH8032850.1 hypothetical protein HPB51_003087 [Rhipicephalus microplus]